MTIVFGVIGLVFGLLVAFINMQITKKFMKQENALGVMAGNSARFILDIAALAAGYFVCKLGGFPFIPVLVSIAVGLSIGGILFLKMLLSKTNEDMNKKEQ